MASEPVQNGSCDVRVALADELVEQIARRAAELVSARPEPWLSQDELAEHLRCSPRTIQNYRRAGMPHINVGSHPRYRASDCEGWLTARTGGGRVEPIASRGGDRHNGPAP